MATEKVTYELSLRDLMTKGLGDINKKLATLEGNLSSAQKQANKSKGVFSDLGGVWSAVAAAGIFAIGKESLDTAAKMEGLSKAIMFSSGSSAEGAKNLEFLHDVTRSMPIDLLSAMEGFKTFNGAVMGSNLEGEKARNIFLQVSKAASVMKLSGEDTTAMFLAMGQMVSKGTVQAEELKGQLGERLPGAFKQVAKAMGLTTMELGELMKEGKITAEYMLPRLANQLNLTYSKGMADANDGIQAHTTRLANLKYEIIEGAIPTMKTMMAAFVDTAMIIRENWEPVGEFFGSIGSMFTDLADISGRFFGSFGLDKSEGILFFFKSLMTVLQAALVPMQMIVGQALNILDIVASVKSGNTEGLWGRIGGRLADPFTKFGEIWSDKKAEKAPLGEAFKSANNMINTGKNSNFSADKEKLKSQSASVSGGVPKVVNINIEAIMKDVKNYFGAGGMNSTQGRDFLDELQQAVNTIVTDALIVSQYGR